MRKFTIVMAGLTAALLAGEMSSAFAQEPPAVDAAARRKVVINSNNRHPGAAKYRPLTVTAPVAAGVGVADSAVGVATGTAGAVVSGVGGLVSAPFAGLGGGGVGISPIAAPPLPIKARYAGTGKVFLSYDEGYSQDVPVDASGPIYKIDDKGIRTVTPFSLAAFPLTAATTLVTAPIRTVTQ